jgi:hypothetical protein
LDSNTLQLLVLLTLGLLLLFFGYPLFRFLVVLAGAAAGFAYGPTLLVGLTGRPVEPWMAVSAAAAAALLLGLLAWLAFWAVVFLWGAVIGYGAVDPYTGTAFVPLLAALVVGVLAVLFQRVLIVLLTAISGAWSTVLAGGALLRLLPAGDPAAAALGPWPLLTVVALAALGAITQFRRAVPPSGL